MQNISNYRQVIDNISRELGRYLDEHPKLESLVLGLSGGIDSAATAALASRVCQEKGIKLIGRSITISSNKPEEIARASGIGEHFTDDFRLVDLSDRLEAVAATAMEDYQEADRNSMAFKIRLGNVKARMRMLYLYDQASKNRGMVLSTDNYTELLLGFWTLHGDVGDFGMLQNLWKSEVYEIARQLAEALPDGSADALKQCIDAVPTDGLGITDTDLEQIGGSSYEEVDHILKSIIEGQPLANSEVAQQVKMRHDNSSYKRENPYNIPRKLIIE